MKPINCSVLAHKYMGYKNVVGFLLALTIIGCGSASDNSSPSANSHQTSSGGNNDGLGGDYITIDSGGSTNNAGSYGIAGSNDVSFSAGAENIAGTDGAGGNGSGTSDGPGIGGGSTSDPGPAVGGGTTQDPGGTGGSGTTEDPGIGGGSTSDPGSGGGNTDDPGSGGGNTDDPGTGGATADPGTGGTNSPGLGGATQDPGTGGTTQDPGTGGATADGGTGGTHEECPWVCIPSAIEGANLIVLNDAAPSGADVEGRMYVGHNATFPGGYAVNAAGTEAGTNDYALVVGNDLTVNGGTVNGAIAFGGEMNGSITATGGITNATPVDFVELTDDMLYWSDTLAASEPNGTVSGGAGLTLTGTDTDINVFEVDASALAAASSLSITVPDGSTVVINVIGTEVSITNMGFSYIGTDSQHVIFNMPQAETVFMSGISLQGTLLAPRADLNFENGNAEGQTIVYNLVTGGGEYHPYYFEGCPWVCL
jgi:choice-of-anchor A domain-containing protein